MFVLFIRFKHLVFHFYLSVAQFLQNLNVFVGILVERDALVLVLIKIIHDL